MTKIWEKGRPPLFRVGEGRKERGRRRGGKEWAMEELRRGCYGGIKEKWERKRKGRVESRKERRE